MKQLYYTFRTLIRGRGANIIKIVSLTLGLLVGILLFTKIAYEVNFDTGYKDSENLCVVMARYTLNGIKHAPTFIVMGPVSQSIAESFPDDIERASVYHYGGAAIYYLGENGLSYETLYGDTLFFQTLGIPVLMGNPMDLVHADAVFISDEFAKNVFGDENPIDQVLMLDKEYELTVKGVFKEMNENNSVRPHAVVSLEFVLKHGDLYFGWNGGDSFQGYIRLRPDADIEKINARMDAAIEPYMEFNPEKNGWGVQYELQKVRNQYLSRSDVQLRILIMSILGFALLLIAALNYVLISISSLSQRAKGIGVHKCSGATTSDIFSMFMWETLIIVVVSLIFAGVLIFSFEELIEDILGASIEGMFVWKTLWVPLSVVSALFIVAGLLLGRMFATIPVSQVFRRYTEGKQGWKCPLLFVQFAGVSFIFGLLCVVVMQYRQIMNYDLGYNPEGLATAYCRVENVDVTKSTMLGLPMVEDVSFSMSNIGTWLSGQFVEALDGRTLFSTRYNYCDYNYVPLMGIKIVEGKNVEALNQVLVNQEYVRLMRWTDSPIVRLKTPYNESLSALNEAIKEIYPTNNIEFKYLPERLEKRYTSTRRFQDMVLIAFGAILIITLIGLIGYVNDEVSRRSKEIAIRKVNGAESYDILVLLSKDLFWTAVPAVIIGTVCSYFAGKEWLTQFERFQMDLGLPLFTLMAIIILILIWTTVILKAWRIANENPVNSIKSE